jgi:multiple sugar transport system ATP-binding protein
VIVGEGPWQGQVRMVEPTGHETIVSLAAGDLVLTARLPGSAPLRAGETLAFDLRRDRLHLFEPKDGRRIEIANKEHG